MEPGDLQILLLAAMMIFVFVLLGMKIGWELRGRLDNLTRAEKRFRRDLLLFPLPDETRRAVFLRRN